MSENRIFYRLNVVDDPPNIKSDGLLVAVFFKETTVMCLTGLYLGVAAGKIMLESVEHLCCDPERVKRELFQFIPWDDVEMLVVLGYCPLSEDESMATVTTLPGIPPISNDVPVFHEGIPIPALFRRKVPTDRYRPYQPRSEIPQPRLRPVLLHPRFEMMQPRSEMMQPRSEMMQPRSEMMQPRSRMVQPAGPSGGYFAPRPYGGRRTPWEGYEYAPRYPRDVPGPKYY